MSDAVRAGRVARDRLRARRERAAARARDGPRCRGQGLGAASAALRRLPHARLTTTPASGAPAIATTGATPEPPYATEDFADDLAALLRHLELGPAHVVGVSMGGAIAMHLAAREPSLVRDADALRDLAEGGRPPPAGLRASARCCSSGSAPRASSGTSRSSPGGRPRGSRAAWRWPRPRRSSGRTRPSGTRRRGGATSVTYAPRSSTTRTEALPAIEAPTLVLVGDADILTPVRFARAMAATIPTARLEVVSRSRPRLPVRGARGLRPPGSVVRRRRSVSLDLPGTLGVPELLEPGCQPLDLHAGADE